MAERTAGRMAGLAAPLLVLALGAAVLGFDSLGMAAALRGQLFDLYARHAGPAFPDSPVRLVEPDPQSLARYGRWPWNDAAMAALAQAARTADARLLVFTTPLDRPSPRLAATLATVPAVAPVLAGVGGFAVPPRTRLLYRGGTDPFGGVPAYPQSAGPVLTSWLRGWGVMDLPPDRDGVLRRLSLAARLPQGLFAALPVEAARLATGATEVTVTGDADDPFSLHWGRAGISGLEMGARLLPADSDGGLWLDFRGRPPAVTAADLLADDAPDAKDRILVLDTPGQTVVTPLGAMTQGAVLATALSDLMTGNVLTRPSFAPALELWGLILGGGLLLLILARLPGVVGAAYAVLLSGMAFEGAWLAFLTRHWLIDAATPSLFLLSAFAAGALARLRDVRLARARLRMAFSDSLPPATVEKIAHQPALLSIEGQTRRITYLVCGVRGLAELAAGLRDEPRLFTQIMQQVLTPLMDQALAHGGTIDRLTGDGFAAFWNAPLDDADHALHACEAASGMSVMASRVSEAIALRRERALPPLEIGIGLATGPAIAGGFGGAGRLGYSVQGDVVGLAGRIQALSPQYGPAVIVADSTQAEAQRGFAFLEVDYIAAGREDPPVRLFALLGNPVVRASPKFRALIAFHEHIFAALRRQQWGAARELIAQCRRLSGASQALYDLHLTRIGYFEKNPPGPSWDGAFRPILK